MKSGLAKRLLSLVLTAALFMGNVMPVMAEGNATVSENNIVNTEEVVTDANQPETPVEPKSVQDIVTAGVAQDIVVNDLSQEPVVEEPVVEETVVEDTVSENEVPEEVVEEIPEEIVESDDVSVSENDIQEEADESVSMNEIPEEEVPLAGTLPVSLEPVTVNGITITVSGPASAFAEGTTVSAVEVEPAEVVIEAAEAEEQAKVMRFKAFDINLVCNGEFVQPLNGEEITVNFEGDLLIPDSEKEEVVVYHVDENDDITKMEAEVATVETEDATEVETVEMTTTHFSTYVVMVTGEGGEVSVTINHLLAGTNKRLFISKEVKVERGGTISDFIKGEGDYSVTSINLGDTPITLQDGKYKVDVATDTAILNVYYSPIVSDETIWADVTFFDYVDGRADNANSINYYQNYEDYEPIGPVPSFNEVKEALKRENPQYWYEGKQSYENRIREIYNERYTDFGNDIAQHGKGRMATKGAYQDYETIYNGKNINFYYGPRDLNKGLLLGLSGEDYQEVDFRFEDPGFFTDEPKNGKQIYTNYAAGFSKEGLQHKLEFVKNKTTNKVVWDRPEIKPEEIKEGSDNGFWPLNEVNGNHKNEYFAYRYDFEFVIGDYVGDMTYDFSGDDDLWVCLNGKVVLDLGGIHQCVPGSVNIWKELTGIDNPTYEQKVDYLAGDKDNDGIPNSKEANTITILYMERGGSLSTCTMYFTMPNIVYKDPVITNVPKAKLEILKKETGSNKLLSGIGFTLYKDEACTQTYRNQAWTVDGKVTFTNLREGTYWLKETDYNTNDYILNNTKYVVNVDATGNGDEAVATIENLNKDGNAYVIYNTPIPKTDLTFVKVDNEDFSVELGGAVFELKSKTTGKVFTATSAEDGTVVFEGVTAGEYELKETAAPTGYKPSNEKLIVNVEENNGVWTSTVTVPNDNEWLLYENKDNTHYIKNIKLINLKILKEWKNYKDETLTEDKITATEVKVTLYKQVEGTTTKDVEREIAITKNAEGKWETLVENLPSSGKAGKWIYTIEEEAITGFEPSYSEKVDEQNPEIKVLVVTNKEMLGSLTINKSVDTVDSVHGTAGFIFKIECPENEIALYRTISFTEAGSKHVTIADLPFGTYTVTELSALRYEADGGAVKQSVIGIGENASIDAIVSYSNDKVFEKLYSHTDVMVNTIVFGSDNKATFSQIKSSSDVEEGKKGE